MTPTIRVASRADLKPIGAVLGRAFHDDPVSLFMTPDEQQRPARLAGVFGAMARYLHMPFGGTEVLLQDGAIRAAALWDPPGATQPAWWRGLLMMAATTRVLRKDASKMATFGQTLDRVRPKDQHWYLAVIGTEPDRQGTGLGTALIRSRLDRCDQEGLPAYLESSKESNVPYYEKFGFKVTQDLQIPDGGPTLWPMWREAGAG